MSTDFREMNSMVSNHLLGGSCAMCRKKSRRCDRARPICGRCTERGLECGGYPEKFRFCGLASRGKWKNRDAPTEDLTTPSADVLWPQGKRQVKSESPRSKRQTQVDRHIAARTKEGLVSPVTERMLITTQWLIIFTTASQSGPGRCSIATKPCL